MEPAKIMHLNIPQNKRIICISDAHGKFYILKRLLDKIGFCDDDILILLGDLYAGRVDNSQSRQIFEFVMELCKRDNVYATRGNWDFAQRLPSDWNDNEKARAAEWLDSLPHIIETQDYIFVHAGLSSNNLNEQDAEKCIRELPDDLIYDKYVIVGHSPTLNYSKTRLSCNPIINTERRLVSIDGALDTWGCGQLNAFIIQNGNFSYQSVDNLPVIYAEKEQQASGSDLVIICYDRELELIEEGPEFSLFRHIKSGREIRLANVFINTEENGVKWCALGTDYFLPVNVGDKISVLHQFSDRMFAKKDGIIGFYKKRW